MYQRSFSLLELIFVMAIITIGYTIAIPNWHYFLYMQYGKLNMQQLQQAVNYARSLAAVHKQNIIICPSHDRLTCANNWNEGILVVAPDNKACFFKVYMSKISNLNLVKSGHTTKRMIIQANNMTHHNGSFTYNSPKHSAFPQFKLYFNKALRIYVIIG